MALATKGPIRPDRHHYGNARIRLSLVFPFSQPEKL